MTLAPLFAQVREESALLADWAEEPLGMGSVDADNVRGRLLAALSVIERHVQDMETAILRHVTQGDVTPYWSSAHLCNGKCPDLDMPDVRDPECLACLAMDFSRAALPASGTRNPRNRVAREKGTE